MKNKYMLFTVLMMLKATIMMCKGYYIIGIIFMILTYILAFLGLSYSLINLIEMRIGKVSRERAEL